MYGRPLTLQSLWRWIEVRFDRAAGPGGQHVNKVSTRVTLLLDFQACTAFSDAERARLRQRLATRLARDGRLRVVSQAARSQAANRALAERRLLDLLQDALRTRKRRRPTRPTAAARERRLKAKRQRGEIKELRRRRPASEE